MKAQKPRVLVLTGDGMSGERELFHAFQLAGFEGDVRHLNDLIIERMSLDYLSSRYGVLAIPSGVARPGEIDPSKVLALKLQDQLGWVLPTFAERGGLILGVGSGFQTLVNLGVFGRDLSLTTNDSGKFQAEWVKVSPVGQKCIWLRGAGTMDLPVRHFAGRMVIGAARRNEVMIKMERQGLFCLRYERNPFGSEEGLAGLCDPTGRIFGLLPHPEAFVRWTAHPEWTAQAGRANAPGQGTLFFENAYAEALRSL
jgi:phosphoribosylformylglycinamidine (FGAM) synthase-like amidotransferase family enzyme